MDILQGLSEKVDMRLGVDKEYERRVVSKDTLLDIGGRNASSKSRRHIMSLSANQKQRIVSTDIVAEYGPDLVDDICNTRIQPDSFDGVYCDAVLEHVTDYQAAVKNIYSILRPGGEAFFYVPFIFPFHDRMDYHRFTFTEVARMLGGFSELKIFAPGRASGWGYIFWYFGSFGLIRVFPRLHETLAIMTNTALKAAFWLAWKLKRSYANTYEETQFWFIYLRVNHGFSAWVRK